MDEQKTTQEVVEKTAEVVEKVTEAAPVQEIITKKGKIVTDNAVAITVGIVGGVAVIAAAKPVWALTKKVGRGVAGLVTKPFRKKEIELVPDDEPADNTGNTTTENK